MKKTDIKKSHATVPLGNTGIGRHIQKCESKVITAPNSIIM